MFRDRVLDIKRTGSRELRNKFLRDYKDDAFSIARIYCFKKLGREPTDEELSIALNAMNEAIDKYDQKKEASFRTFTDKVISSRLLDFFRKEKVRRKYVVSHPNVAMLSVSERQSIAEYRTKQLSDDINDEIIEVIRILGDVGYTWDEAMQNKPSHRDSLARLKNIAHHIVSLRVGERFIKENPLSREMRKLIGVDRKTLKKYRPYLCVLIIVLLYDFPVIRSYVGFRKEFQNENP